MLVQTSDVFVVCQVGGEISTLVVFRWFSVSVCPFSVKKDKIFVRGYIFSENFLNKTVECVRVVLLVFILQYDSQKSVVTAFCISAEGEQCCAQPQFSGRTSYRDNSCTALPASLSFIWVKLLQYRY